MSIARWSKNPYWENKLNVEPIYHLETDGVLEFHQKIEGYQASSLVELPSLAAELGVGKLWVKDESTRFNLNAFKALGASYAAHKWMEQNQQSQNPEGMTFCTATDGNHGRAVAWSAKKLGVKAVIYVPQNTVSARIDSIKSEGAEVVVVPSHYDDTVLQAASDASKNGWQVISDTAYEGYMEIPKYIMSGYSTIFRELESTMGTDSDPGVDYVFLQAGVGGLAAAASWYYGVKYQEKRPRLICVEPTDADCLLVSIENEGGEMKSSNGAQDSIMAGLNCGTPSMIAWPVIKQMMYGFMSISDDDAKDAMKVLGRPVGNDQKIISGESGAAGMGGLLALMRDPKFEKTKQELGIGVDSKILIISTEGDTDPGNYQRILNEVENDK
ncbi:MAG: diaminopropionate ammonia-lyase [Bacteriovoracaceae bacterium]|jgi:diaminopropionate ammonia-lyase|nr:diaminopropionate ammonia-lyase [Bacteriovoracaceae bacterium]